RRGRSRGASGPQRESSHSAAHLVYDLDRPVAVGLEQIRILRANLINDPADLLRVVLRYLDALAILAGFPPADQVKKISWHEAAPAGRDRVSKSYCIISTLLGRAGARKPYIFWPSRIAESSHSRHLSGLTVTHPPLCVIANINGGQESL